MQRAGSKAAQQHAITRIELVQAKSVWYYRPGPQDTFYKITTSMPNLVTTARSAHLTGFIRASNPMLEHSMVATCSMHSIRLWR